MAPLDQLDVDSSGTMSFGDHLEELRSRVFKALIIIIPLAFLTYAFSSVLLDLLKAPLQKALIARGLPDTLQVLSPPEALLTQLKLSIISAVIISAPWIIWQIWQFIKPGLYLKERRFIYFLMPGSAILTTAGISLFYFVMLPLVLVVLIGFGTTLDNEPTLKEQLLAAPESWAIDAESLPFLPMLAFPPRNPKPGTMWLSPDHELHIVVQSERGGLLDDIEKDESGNYPLDQLEIRRIPLVRQSAIAQEFRLTTYVNFVIILALGMVIAFQTPLVMLLLSWMDLLRVDWLKKNRTKALFGSAVLGAVLTPADPWSMIAMMIPLYLLFELGVIMMQIFPAKRVAEGGFISKKRSDKDESN